MINRFLTKITTGTKRCGFYNDGLTHGGPNGGEENQAGPIDNEQTQLTDNANEYSPDNMEVYNPRPNRRRRDADDLGNVLRANQSIRKQSIFDRRDFIFSCLYFLSEFVIENIFKNKKKTYLR